jgi:hypothetical protein
MLLNRAVVNWSGTPIVGLAVNVLHYAGDVGAVNSAALRTAYATLTSILSTGVSIDIPNTGEKIEDTTGVLDSVWTSTGGTPVVGAAGGVVAAGVGACITWKTGGIIDGRRLRGRTFIVPLSSTAYEANGTLTTAALTALNNFGTSMLASGPLAVWHRPTSEAAADGNSYGVVAFSVRDKVAFLSSRRD